MNSRVKVVILVGALALGLWAIGCSQGVSSPGNQVSAPTTTPLTPTPAGLPPTSTTTDATPQPAPGQEQAPAELISTGPKTQSLEVNKVTIQATPPAKLVIGNRELTFNIVMDTHSVNLDVYDLTALATLKDSQGREYKATSWQAPKGGHHRSGVLTFSSNQPLLQPDTQYIELLIKDIANVPARLLRWELRPASS